MRQLLSLLAFLPLLIAVRLRRVERSMLARLRDAGATTGERGILMPQDGLFNRFVFDRLRRAGVLQDAGNDRYYLHDAAYAGFRAARRRRALAAATILLIGVALLYLRGEFR